MQNAIENDEKCGRSRGRLVRTGAAVSVAAGTLAAGVGTVGATPVDPLGGAVDTGIDDAQTWVTTYGVPAMVTAIVFGAIIGIGLRWLSRATNRAGRG
jgi:hypothetical protein